MPKRKKELTFLELMEQISEAAKNDDEVIATVTHLVNSGRVRFPGNLAGAKNATRPTLDAFLNKVRSKPALVS